MYRASMVAVVTSAFLCAGSTVAAQGKSEQHPLLSWSQKLTGDFRFLVLSDWNNEAVLDRETGLVWEQTPWCSNPGTSCAATPFFEAAQNRCISRVVGNRLGWRLPSREEFLTLVDPQRGALPVGSPFLSGIGPQYGDAPLSTVPYWTSTLFLNNVGDLIGRYAAQFTPDSSGRYAILGGPQSNPMVWCVRGGEGRH